jgi:Reverse transcriptase (RNA-dependent DNA polymerase)
MSGIQQPSVVDSFQYFVTFIDDYTRHCWVYFTTNKDAKTISEVYKVWVADVENKAGTRVSYLQTDQGGEYESTMGKLLIAGGTTHLPSTAYSPESNGLAERQNRTLKDTARTLLQQAGTPSSFWPKAIKAACDIRNRLPHSSLPDQMSPFEAFYRQKPSLERFKTFGSLAFPLIPKESRPKQPGYETRARRCIIVGYPAETIYEYYDFEKKEFNKSHNLEIWENQFPSPQYFNDPSIPKDERFVPAPSQARELPSPKPIYDEIVVQPPPKIVGYTKVANSVANSVAHPVNENPSYQEAINGPDKAEWIKATRAEIDSIVQNNTWKLVQLPPGRKPIGVKWVLTVKRDAKGKITKHKARLVAKGFSQQFGFDFEETFAPVVRIEHVRILLAIAALLGLSVNHLDAKNAFLNGKSDFAIYINQPEGFEDSLFPHYVLLLLKSLYGLKQAPRIWYLTLYEAIIALGFTPSEFDPCIFISKTKNLIIAIYVDDILTIGPQDVCDEFARLLGQQFRISNQGPVSSFLGINIQRSRDTILLNQIGYIDRMAKRFQLESSNPVHTPLDHSLPLLNAKPHDRRADPTLYKELIGSLNHLAIYTRPDISFAVSKLAQFNQDPTTTHLNAARRVLKYVITTKLFTIKYGGKDEYRFDGYADADWGSDLNHRKSITGCVFMMNGGPISWESHKQTTVALSTAEGELMALSDAAREALAHLTFFQTLSIQMPIPILFTDNEAAEAITKRPELNYRRSKHIDIRYHFLRDHFEKGTFDVQHIPGREQIADIFTKPLPRFRHQELVQALRLI